MTNEQAIELLKDAQSWLTIESDYGEPAVCIDGLLQDAIDHAIQALTQPTSEAVQRAIELQERYIKSCQDSIDCIDRKTVAYSESRNVNGEWTNKDIGSEIKAKEQKEMELHKLAITALRQMQEPEQTAENQSEQQPDDTYELAVYKRLGITSQRAYELIQMENNLKNTGGNGNA